VAGPGGNPSIDLKLDLLKKGSKYSFIQVMRLLRLLSRLQPRSIEGEAEQPTGIRVRPELSLAFPASEVARVEELPGEQARFRVTATFLGLYGVSSPLPSFYTEDLLEEEGEDLSASRDFLDLVNQPLYELLFRCWTKYRPFLKVGEERDPVDLERLFCLAGLGEPEFRKDVAESYSLLRYVGLFTQFPRSALGLETLLRDSLGEIPVEVFPCRERTVTVPEDQQCRLGVRSCTLGGDGLVGDRLVDRTGKFRLRIGPVGTDDYHDLLPGGAGHRKLVSRVRFYLPDPLEYDIELLLEEGETRTACLGGTRWAALGHDTWTFSGDLPTIGRSTFSPQFGKEAHS